MQKEKLFVVFVFLLMLQLTIVGPAQINAQTPYQPTWNTLKNWYTPLDIRFTIKDNNLYATVLDWPGEKVLIMSLAPKGHKWAGLYPSEIASVTMLGDGKELKWEMTKEGLSIETPKTKPCDHAYVFRIVRRKPF